MGGLMIEKCIHEVTSDLHATINNKWANQMGSWGSHLIIMHWNEFLNAPLSTLVEIIKDDMCGLLKAPNYDLNVESEISFVSFLIRVSALCFYVWEDSMVLNEFKPCQTS